MWRDDTAHNRRIGIALVALAMALFSTVDASAKWLVQTLPVFEVVWLRLLAHVVISSALLAPTYGYELVRVGDWRLHLLRALMFAVMTALNIWALQYLQLATVGSIMFSTPILIALLSAWWLRERIDARRWVAICAGFGGVLLVVGPGTQAFHPAVLVICINAAIYAAFNLLTRRMAATESPAAVQLLSAAGATVLIAPFALMNWEWPGSWQQWILVAVCGFSGGMGHYIFAKAHRHATAATLGPFLYQQMLYMAIWGWLLFGHVPDIFIVCGAAIVVASGLYLFWLQARSDDVLCGSA